MTPRRRTRSPRSFAAAGLLLGVALGGAGCQSFGRGIVSGLLGRDYVYRDHYRYTQATENRRWTIQYVQHLRLTAALPHTHAVVNGEDLGPCPVDAALPPRPLDIEETGFYPAYEVYELTYRKNDDGTPGRLVSEKYLRTQRAAGPTRWVGHRVVTADLPPLTVEWVREDQVLGTVVVEPVNETFTIRTAPDTVDPVLVAALGQLEWNRPATDPAVPGEAPGQRRLHWPAE